MDIRQNSKEGLKKEHKIHKVARCSLILLLSEWRQLTDNLERVHRLENEIATCPFVPAWFLSMLLAFRSYMLGEANKYFITLLMLLMQSKWQYFF